MIDTKVKMITSLVSGVDLALALALEFLCFDIQVHEKQAEVSGLRYLSNSEKGLSFVHQT